MAAKKKKSTGKKASKKTASKKTSKSSKKSNEEKKVFYVGVEDSLSKQREVLKITADYLRMLKNIEQVKQVRVKKKAIMTDFHNLMKEIRSDASDLYKLLPKYDLPKRVVQKAEPEVPKEVVQQAVKKVAVHSEIDSLEAELAAIESKLGSMQ